MVGSLSLLALLVGLFTAQDPARLDSAGEQIVPFVPREPRTARDRERLEALQLYTTARALEARRQIPAAIAALEDALKKEPQSLAILKRLGILCRAVGRLEEAIGYARRTLEIDPADTTSILLSVGYQLEVKNDPAGAAALLEGLRDDPKLDRRSAGRLLIQRILGDLRVELLGQLDASADAYAEVVGGLEGPGAINLTEAERSRILRNNPAVSYLRFGEVFLRDDRASLAVDAFRRSLSIDADQPEVPRLLAEALLAADQPAEALGVLEPYLRRQPQGREPYELLGKILKSLGREGEYVGRLEEYARADSKNLSLQFALAERYRASGREADAEQLLRELLRDQGDPQVFGPLSASLLAEKKTDELVKLLRDALEKRGGPEAVMPQIEAIAKDPDYAAKVLDAALALFEAEPQKFGDRARKVFALVANQAMLPDRLIALDRLVVANDPRTQTYYELTIDQFRNGRYTDAAETASELIEKFPADRNPVTLGLLSRSLFFAGKIGPALDAAREAEKLDPTDRETLFLIGYLLGRMGRNQEAIDHYKAVLDRFPNDDEVERRARSGLSSIYVNLEDFEHGEQELEILLDRFPDDPVVNNDLGYLYADQGKNLDRAEAMIRKALEDEPDNNSYLDSLGWVLYQQGRYEEALVPLEKAAGDPAADVTVLDHLGDAYFRLKSYEKAKETWGRARTLAEKPDPPDERLPGLRKKLDELETLERSSRPSEDDPAPASPSRS